MNEELFQQLMAVQNEILKWVKSEGNIQQEFFSVNQIAKMAGLSRDHVQRAVDNGELLFTDKGRGKKRLIRIARDDFERWMRDGRTPLPSRSELQEKINRYLPGCKLSATRRPASSTS
jgi:excisionase family DNA binding protein